jgi:hypothetical protein
MPYLFCEQHGPEHQARCDEEQESYGWLGETVLIVTGPIKSPSWRCSQCHARMRRGRPAWLVTAFPRPPAEDLDGYVYAIAQEYFMIEHVQVTVYGAEPPARMTATAALTEPC